MTVENEAVQGEVENQEVESQQSEVQSAYDRIANPDKATEDEQVTQPATAETPPQDEPVLTREQAQDLMAQVGRIPELQKQLRDAGGRYGEIKQQVEQLQKRLTTSSTAGEASADAGELLKDLRDEFPELADKLEGAFSKVMANKGGIDQSGIDQIVSARIQSERQAAIEEAKQSLTEAHPDWQEVITAPTYAEWRSTLPPRVNARITSSQDPFFAAEMLDQHKEWLVSKTTKQPAKPAEPSKRLANAVMPSGTRGAPQGEPDKKAAIRAAYEKVAGARR